MSEGFKGFAKPAKDKKLTDKYKITFDNVKEAYPDIQWGGRS